jgi:hypothetical protein
VLAVDGDVLVESPALRVRIEGAGSTVNARIDGTLGMLAALRYARRARPLLRKTVPLLVRAGITVNVWLGSIRIARAGAGIDANRLGRALQLEHVEVGR